MGNNDTLAAGLADVIGLGLGLGATAVAVLLIRVAASGATAVQKDAVAGAGDAVAFASAAAGGAGHGGSAGAGGGAGAGQGWDIRLGVGVVAVALVIKLDLVEAGAELLKAGGLAGGDDVLGLAGLDWLGGDDASGGDWAALGDGARGSARGAAGLDGGSGSWDIEDVQLAAGGGLDGVLAGGIVGDVISVKDVVVPVALALLDQGALEAERSLEATRLGGVLGERKLTGVVVPRTDEVDGFAVGGGAESKVHLDGRHYEWFLMKDWKLIVWFWYW